METYQHFMNSRPSSALDLPTIVPPDLDLAIFPRVIEHMPEFRVLYCHLCKQACFPSSLHTHLSEIHKVKAAIRRPIVEFCQTLDLVETALDLELPLDRSASLHFAPVYDGYSYCYCRFLSVSRKVVRVHLNAVHGLVHPATQTKMRRVRLQS
jgi:hypothetical protein